MEAIRLIGKDQQGNDVAVKVGADGTMTNNSNLAIAKGQIDGHTYINKFGENHDVDTGTVPEDIWSGGGIYTPPTTDRTHQIVSTSTADAGTLRGTYTSTNYGATTLIDSGATFITDSVAIGDTIVDDTNQDHSIVVSVDSETQLTIEAWHHDSTSNVGNTIRIATNGGTGAVFVHIKQGYHKGSNATFTEFVLLNGTTNVPTVNTYYRITRAHIHGVGSNKSNVGDITLTADTDATVTAFIDADHSQTLMAFIHVPQGKTAYIGSYTITMYRATKIANAMAHMQLINNLWGSDVEIVMHSTSVGATGGMVRIPFEPPLKVTQGTDLWVRCVNVTDDNSEISASFDAVLVDN